MESDLAECGPQPGAVLSEALGEGSQVGCDPSRDEDVSCQVVIGSLQLLGLLRPSDQPQRRTNTRSSPQSNTVSSRQC